MTRYAQIPGKRNKPYLIRRITIGLAMVSVLMCSILGSGILTLQEGVQYAGVFGTPTQTLQTWVGATTPTSLPLPSQTPAGSTTPVSTATQVTASTSLPGQESPGTATPTPVSLATATVPAAILPLPTATTVRCRPPASWQAYIVRAGDTITQLAWRHGTTVAAIMQGNCLHTAAVFAGQRLYLPPRQVLPTPVPTRCVPRPPADWVRYTVRQGDTLYGLALRHRTTLSRIQSVNCLNDYRLYAGQQIYLPPLPPTATPVWTLAPTSTPTPAAPWTPTETVEPTATATWPATQTATAEPTLTPITPTQTPVTPTPAQTLTLTPGPTPTWSPTSTWTPTPTASFTVVPSPTPSATATTAPTETAEVPTPTATHAPTATPPPIDTPTPTDTAVPTAAPTATTAPPTATPAASPTTPPTATYTPNPSPTPTSGHVP